jgi:tRNA 2-selenouridine synthase
MIKAPIFNNDKELFEYVRKFDIKSIPGLEKTFFPYNFRYLDIEMLENIIFDENLLLIDARSEKEYSDTSIPCAVNFPVLNIQERHNVGLIYRKYSRKASVKLAMDYADLKVESLQKFLKSKNAGEKKIIVYCWRGGGRSKYLAKMISDSGYDVSILIKGIKSYRNKAVKLFELNPFPCEFLEIRGMTGCGKTEILRKLMKDLPVIDLEDAARHFSSLFGQIPYNLRNTEPVSGQTAFENNIYSQLLRNKYIFPNNTVHIVESESKKVGDFIIPGNLFSKIETARCINIHSSLSSRIKRIEADYFPDAEKGTNEMMKVLYIKEKFFRKEMSSKYYESATAALKDGKTTEFCEIMLTRYYDSKYRVKDKKPVSDIDSDDMEEALREIKIIYEGL